MAVEFGNNPEDKFTPKQIANAHEVIFSLSYYRDGKDNLETVGFLGAEVSKSLPDCDNSKLFPQKLGSEEYKDAEKVFETIKESEDVKNALESGVLSQEAVNTVEQQISRKKFAALKERFKSIFPKLEKQIGYLSDSSLDSVEEGQKYLKVSGSGPFPLPGEKKRIQRASIEAAHLMQVLGEIENRDKMQQDSD